MANKVTLATLRDRALNAADMTSSGFPVEALVNDDINDGLAELHDLLAAHEYYRSTHPLTLAVGTEEYALPADFYKAARVWELSSGRRYVVDRFNLSQLNGATTTGPRSAGSAEIWYAPQLTRLTKDDDQVSLVMPTGWDVFAALHAAVQLLIREESDPQALMAERERARQRILASLEPRDAGIPDEIEDHYGRWSTNINDSALRYRILGDKILFVELGE